MSQQDGAPVNSLKNRLAAAKSALADGAHKEAFLILTALVTPGDDFVNQARVAKLSLSINQTLLGLQPIRIALLASTTLDHFSDILRFWLAQEGFAADLWIAPYDTIVPTIMDEGSDLYSFRPDIVWIFTTHRDVRVDVAAGGGSEVQEVIAAAVATNTTLWQTIQHRLSCVILQNNADIPAGDPFGNYAGQVEWTRRNMLRRYNLSLGSAAPFGVVIFDLDHVAANFGRARWVDWRYWYHSKHAFTFDACGTLAFHAARLIAGLKGCAKKAIVLDLDNTLWGGVIGDDGLSGIKLGNGADGEAFVDFQRYVLTLKQRGIILAVCSKNEEENAKEPFLKHPDMVLKLEDIAVFRANWQNKADNICDIARILNIGADSLVFIDDSPLERNLVREFMPMVAVPELPEDPARYVQCIEEHCYFETVSFSPEDTERAAYYRTNAMRSELVAQFTNVAEYLRSLQMVSERGNLNPLLLPRMAQLINKSNQFHLTGTRYSEVELQACANRAQWLVRYYKLSDRFGDNGLISVVVLNGSIEHTVVIDTWVMSCRVLGRTMEEFIHNDIIEIARGMDCHTVIGRYLPSAKNKLVANLYSRLGFSQVSDEGGVTTWCLEMPSSPQPLETFITSLG